MIQNITSSKNDFFRTFFSRYLPVHKMNTENLVGKYIEARVYVCPFEKSVYTGACKVISQTPTSLTVFIEDCSVRYPEVLAGKTIVITYLDVVRVLSHFPLYDVGQGVTWSNPVFGYDFVKKFGVVTGVRMTTTTCAYTVCEQKTNAVYTVYQEKMSPAFIFCSNPVDKSDILQQHGIFSKKDYHAWCVKNHPDKCEATKECVELFQAVSVAANSRFP
jgi:hypothetical protein